MAPPVAGYIGWWDASAITSPPADGGALSTWNDLSGHGVNLTAAGSPPTYYSSTTAKLINGHPAVWFTPSTPMQNTAGITQAQPFTWYVVAQNTVASPSTVYDLLYAAGGAAVSMAIYSGSEQFGIFGGTSTLLDGAGDTAVHVIYGLFNGASSHVRVDAADTAGSPGSTGMSGSFTVGASGSSTFGWSGPICEVIVYPSAVTGANDTSIYNYLHSKWFASPTVTGTATVTVGPLIVASTPGTIGACLRKAWLTLGSLDVSLEDPTQGYFCTQLDLGYPTVRQVVSDNPDRDGAQDRTQYLGPRVVSANITTLAGAGGRIDQIASMFAPFMLPSSRPTLHYVLDRPGLPERTLTLRASGYAWPVSGPYQRDIQLQWVAADPVARDPNLRTVTAITLSPASILTPGDVPVRPVFRVTGPITAPAVLLTGSDPPYPTWTLAFLAGFTIAAGHFVEVDTEARTVLLDGNPSKPRLASMDWTVSSWQWIAPYTPTQMSLTGTGASSPTRVDAFWQDGYLN